MNVDLVLNDIPFSYSFESIHTLSDAVDSFIRVALEFMKMRRDVALIFDEDVRSIELMQAYPLVKLFNETRISKDNQRVLLKLFSRIKKIDTSIEKDYFVFDERPSALCGYAINNRIPVVSMISRSCFDTPWLNGTDLDNEKTILANIAKTEHIMMHADSLKIRIYELNPKHKLGFNWGSPMDLDDSLAQKVLDTAIIYDADDKCLVNKYNDNYYVFRRHIGVFYHGYINNSIPENVKRRFCDEQ